MISPRSLRTVVSPILSSFVVFFGPVLEEFQWSRGSTTIAMSIHLLMAGLASPVAGGLIDRYPPRSVMPIGLSRSTALWHFYLGFGVLAAVGSAMLQITPLTAIISNWFVRHRGTAIGIVSAGAGAGQLVLLPLLQYLVQTVGWRGAYVVPRPGRSWQNATSRTSRESSL